MNIFNDRRLEAASKKRGAPPGPRILPRVAFDDEGHYTIWPGKACTAPGCGLQLTSRNRYGTSLLCLEHGREMERSRVRKPARPRAAPKAADTCPHRANLRAIFAVWLKHPAEERFFRTLRQAMDAYELRERLMRAIQPSAQVSAQVSPLHIPVEEPTFTNPEHRTTRLEFLADADHYGV